MITATIQFDEFTDLEDAKRAINGLDKILRFVHHPAQIENAHIERQPVVGFAAEIIDAEFTVIEIREG